MVLIPAPAISNLNVSNGSLAQRRSHWVAIALANRHKPYLSAESTLHRMDDPPAPWSWKVTANQLPGLIPTPPSENLKFPMRLFAEVRG